MSTIKLFTSQNPNNYKQPQVVFYDNVDRYSVYQISLCSSSVVNCSTEEKFEKLKQVVQQLHEINNETNEIVSRLQIGNDLLSFDFVGDVSQFNEETIDFLNDYDFDVEQEYYSSTDNYLKLAFDKFVIVSKYLNFINQKSEDEIDFDLQFEFKAYDMDCSEPNTIYVSDVEVLAKIVE
jgi:hypothetical protein